MKTLISFLTSLAVAIVPWFFLPIKELISERYIQKKITGYSFSIKYLAFYIYFFVFCESFFFLASYSLFSDHNIPTGFRFLIIPIIFFVFYFILYLFIKNYPIKSLFKISKKEKKALIISPLFLSLFTWEFVLNYLEHTSFQLLIALILLFFILFTGFKLYKILSKLDAITSKLYRLTLNDGSVIPSKNKELSIEDIRFMEELVLIKESSSKIRFIHLKDIKEITIIPHSSKENNSIFSKKP